MVKAATQNKERRLTKKQTGFVKDYVDTGNATLAAKKNYDVSGDAVARSIGSENLTKPNIKAYLESKAERAAEIVFSIAENGENDGVRLSASKDILDRAGHKAPEKHVTVSLTISKEDREKMLGISTKVLEQMTHEEVNG